MLFGWPAASPLALNMLRKLSTKFKSKREVNGVNGTNGTTHGVTNGTNGGSKEKPALKERHSSFTPFKSKKETSDHVTDHSASRADVENSFEQFAQLIHANVRNQLSSIFISTATGSQGIFPKRQIFFGLHFLS